MAPDPEPDRANRRAGEAPLRADEDPAPIAEAQQPLGRPAEEDGALLRALFETAPVGLAFYDRDLRFVRVNSTLAAANGLSPASHVGHALGEIGSELPVDELERHLRRVLDTGEAEFGVELAGHAAGGERRYWAATFFPVRVRGVVVGVGSMLWDVTRQRMAEAFNRHLVGIVSHDLRTPLSAVALALHLLGASGPTEGQRPLLDRARTSLRRIQGMVADLLDFTLAGTGRPLPLQLRQADIGDVCRDAVEEARAANPERSVRLSGEGDGGGRWDPQRVAQAIGNLISNGIKHGAPDAPIDVSWRGLHDDVMVEVRNVGPSIPSELVDHVFEPFRQGSGSSRSAGLGLGLFIARCVVLAHAGEISVRSSAAEGTLFTIRLPRSRPSETR